MAQKESQHKEVVESLNTQLERTRRELESLTTLSRDQVGGGVLFSCNYSLFLRP